MKYIAFSALLLVMLTCTLKDELSTEVYINILRQYDTYSNSDTDNIFFHYSEPSEENLTLLRTTYNLDAVAGSGDEISRILNLMEWVHDTVPHSGSAPNPDPPNALQILEQGTAVNCRMVSTVLNEVYLSMGYPSRILTCLPEIYPTEDCHVVNMVFSRTLEKWLLMDASFRMYFLDENDNILSPEEIRERYISGLSVRTNPEVNHNGHPNRDWAEAYMIKNLVWFNTPLVHSFNTEGTPGTEYIALIPENVSLPSPGGNWTIISTPGLFWQNP